MMQTQHEMQSEVYRMGMSRAWAKLPKKPPSDQVLLDIYLRGYFDGEIARKKT